MSRSIVFAVCAVIGLSAAPLMAADQWANASVVLKHPAAKVRPGETGSQLSLFQVGWPATVLKNDGTWALLVGAPGFQRNPEIGWVRTYDLVNGNTDPLSGTDSRKYTVQIEKSPDATTRAVWHWLRGIYWDTNSDTRAAIKDYALAIYDLDGPVFAKCNECASCNDWSLMSVLRQEQSGPSSFPVGEPSISLTEVEGLALRSDCYRRLGTALAGDDAVCNYDCLQKCFEKARENLDAQKKFIVDPQTGEAPAAPRLRYEWGGAYALAFSEIPDVPTDPQPPCDSYQLPDKKTLEKEAHEKLTQAAQLAPKWADPRVGLGDLKVAYVTWQIKQKKLASSDRKDELQSAAADYTDAIQCDSGSDKAYRGRANALQQLAYQVAREVSPAPSGTCKCTSDAPCALPGDVPLCQLGQQNASKNSQIALAKVTSILTDAATSAYAAAKLKNFSDAKSITQYATVLRDLAYLNDSDPKAAFPYAMNAFNYAAHGIEFADKTDDGVALQKLAECLWNLAQCYQASAKKPGPRSPGGPAAAPPHELGAPPINPAEAAQGYSRNPEPQLKLPLWRFKR